MSIHAAATELMETEAWDLAAVYYVGIDHFSHRFMRYHAGKNAPAGDADPSLLSGVVENGYRYHDLMLGRLLALAGPDCAVMLLSDHGFHSDNLLPDYIPAEAAGPAVEHRSFGIFCMAGPGVRTGEKIYGASVLDVTPTALHLLGLPAGMDMDGRVLVNAFNDGRPVEKVESWDAVEGEDGSHPAGARYDGAAAVEALNHLVDLGYVAPPGKDARSAVDECLAEQRYNLALAHADAGRPDLAVPLLRDLIARDSEQARFYSALITCLMQLGDTDGCQRVLDDFDQASARFAPVAAGQLERRRAEKPDSEIGVWQDPNARLEIFERRQLAEKASGFVQMRLVLRCRLALIECRSPRQREQALELLEQVAKSRGQSADARLFLAQGFATLKAHDRALEQLERVRRADRDNWEALGLEARIHFEAGRYEDAVNRAVESLSLVYAQPWLHHLL
jgi:Flp pilus assembly protein TadD